MFTEINSTSTHSLAGVCCLHLAEVKHALLSDVQTIQCDEKTHTHTQKP